MNEARLARAFLFLNYGVTRIRCRRERSGMGRNDMPRCRRLLRFAALFLAPSIQHDDFMVPDGCGTTCAYHSLENAQFLLVKLKGHVP